MTQPFPHLFSPLKLNSTVLKHRLNFGAHTANMSVDGYPVDRHLGYYRERAIGGAAMSVVEPVPVHHSSVLTRGNFRCEDDSVIPYFRRIADAVHEHGTVIIQQMYHLGAHGDWDNGFEANWSPSGLPSMHDTDGSHAMIAAEIEEIIAAHVQAARRAKEAGFDGCELMAAYNALIEQFWSPYSNRRDDRAWPSRPRCSREFGARPDRTSSSASPSASIPRVPTCCRWRCSRRSPSGTTPAASTTTSASARAVTSTSPRSSRPSSTPTNSARLMPKR